MKNKSISTCVTDSFAAFPLVLRPGRPGHRPSQSPERDHSWPAHSAYSLCQPFPLWKLVARIPDPWYVVSLCKHENNHIWQISADYRLRVALREELNVTWYTPGVGLACGLRLCVQYCNVCEEIQHQHNMQFIYVVFKNKTWMTS